jgi:hypothetical protein
MKLLLICILLFHLMIVQKWPFLMLSYKILYIQKEYKGVKMPAYLLTTVRICSYSLLFLNICGFFSLSHFFFKLWTSNHNFSHLSICKNMSETLKYIYFQLFFMCHCPYSWSKKRFFSCVLDFSQITNSQTYLLWFSSLSSTTIFTLQYASYIRTYIPMLK